MRAGSLSEPRIVALLREHFVCVHMTELCTKHLIPDEKDVALLEKYSRAQGVGRPNFSPGLYGGERELFFTPDGELVALFLSLHKGLKGEEQMTGKGRRHLDPAVDHFFRMAARTLEKSHGKLPEDFEALQDGTAPAVAKVKELQVPRPRSRPGHGDVVVWVRNDLVMYDGLVGEDRMQLAAKEARSLLPADLEAGGGVHRWPAELFKRFGHATYPRGAGVQLELKDESVTGFVESSVLSVEDGVVSGTFRGELALSAGTTGERGYRSSYRPFRSARCKLVGDFEWDVKAGSFRSFRLVSRDGQARYANGGKIKQAAWAIGAEQPKRSL